MPSDSAFVQLLEQSDPHIDEVGGYRGESLERFLDTLAAANYASFLLSNQYAANSVDLGRHLHFLYRTNPTFSRVVNQFAEQSFANAYVAPVLRNPGIQEVISDWWVKNRWEKKVLRAYKQYLVSGEFWIYIPRTRRREFKGRILIPWQITSITGFEPEDWESATYHHGPNADDSVPLTLTPENTCFVPHDAMFDSLRGVSPFASMWFALQRYDRWLEGRERINKRSGNVVGHMHFNTVEDAGRALGWKKDESGAFVPQMVKMPQEQSVVITAGEGADFKLLTPQVGGRDAMEDGQAFYNATIEASRLPEYFSGNGNNVNVATARVQYPVAVRAIMALRDEFDDAIEMMIRLLLRRLANAKVISEEWPVTLPDGSTAMETPETAVMEMSWPEMRELEFDKEFEALDRLHDKGLLTDESLLRQLGYDPDVVMPDEAGRPPEPDEEVRRQALRDIKEALKRLTPKG